MQSAGWNISSDIYLKPKQLYSLLADLNEKSQNNSIFYLYKNQKWIQGPKALWEIY